ncbi:hypothetical protein JCM8202_005953 [Rhodotorula sphaerocarpa]
MSIPDALHAPSGRPAASNASNPPRHGDPSAPVTLQSELRRLTDARKNIDAQLEAYFDVLKSNNCTMDTPLVDREGYPRADIDVAGVRTARVHILRLRNDLKTLLGEMEQVVHRGLPREEAGATANGAEEEAGPDQASAMEVDAQEKPFARVDAVAPNSPANEANLLREDLILSLGTVSSADPNTLPAAAALVGRSEGVALPVVVLRAGVKMELTLTPRSGWGGRGLLGCHIVPV